MQTIVHISSSLGGGGAEQMVLQLARQSHPRIKTVVFSLSSVNILESKFSEHNIEVHFLNISSFKNATLTKGLKLLHEKTKDLENVVFHCHQFHSCWLGLLHNLKYKKRPIVFTLHSSTVASLNRRILLFLTKPFRKRDIIFSNNAKKWYLKNSVIIPNGVNFKAFEIDQQRSYQTNSIFIYLFLGRLSKEKNPLSLIDFCKNLLQKGSHNFKINVVGDGAQMKDLSIEIEKNNLQTYFDLTGFQIDFSKYINTAHCLLLPSLWEGLPLVLIEAAAAKLPIIATPVGSIPDYFNESNAYICKADLFPEVMANMPLNYQEALAKSEVLYNELKVVFDIESVYQSHESLYRDLLKKN